MDALETFRAGAVIPAHPLALTEDLRIDERRQRALSRYYLASGAGGLADPEQQPAELGLPGDEGRTARWCRADGQLGRVECRLQRAAVQGPLAGQIEGVGDRVVRFVGAGR